MLGLFERLLTLLLAYRLNYGLVLASRRASLVRAATTAATS